MGNLRRVVGFFALGLVVANSQGCAFLTALARTGGAAPAPRQIRPTSASSFNVLCVVPRSIVIDSEMLSPGEIEAAKAAIVEINRVIPGLLVLVGEVSHREAVASVEKGLTAFTAPPERVDEDTIAVTLLTARKICIDGTPIIYLSPKDKFSQADVNQVMLHELMHSLGYNHHDGDSPISSVMRPGLSSEHRVGLSKADENSLKSVYGDSLPLPLL